MTKFSVTKFSKTTLLDGYYATGDWESFVFDRHAGPEEHQRAFPNRRDDCRVYPEALLPDGVGRRKGRWKITVEFEPVEDP